MAPLKFTEEMATKHGYIACGPITRVLNQWLEEQYDRDGQIKAETGEQSVLNGLAYSTGLSVDLFSRISRGEKTWIGFDNADKIICATYGPLAWVTEPDLKELYEGFDLSYLDLMRCPRPDADGAITLYDSGIRSGILARLYGVDRDTFYRGVTKQKAALAVG